MKTAKATTTEYSGHKRFVLLWFDAPARQGAQMLIQNVLQGQKEADMEENRKRAASRDL